MLLINEFVVQFELLQIFASFLYKGTDYEITSTISEDFFHSFLPEKP